MIVAKRGKNLIAVGALIASAPACAEPGMADLTAAVPLDRAALSVLTALADVPGRAFGLDMLTGSDPGASTIMTSVGNDPAAGVREDHVEVVFQSGQHSMSVGQVAGGNSATIVQTASVDLPRPVPGGPETIGVLYQSAVYDLAHGSQAATNVAFTVALADAGDVPNIGR